jgi:hemoglobin-like flavoprotein
MDAKLLKQSFDLVAPQKEAFAEAFYNRLFALYPQTKTLFANTDMKRQQSSLMATLTVVVTGMVNGENVIPTIEQLWHRHNGYGVKPEYYPMIGQALLETLKEFLGKDWTPEIEATWTATYQVITQAMQHEAVQ